MDLHSVPYNRSILPRLSKRQWVCKTETFMKMYLGASPVARTIVNRTALARCCYRMLNMDEYETINFTEYTRLLDILMNLHASPDIETDILFSMFDMDGDQILSRVELCQLLAFFLGKTPPVARLDQVWKEIAPHSTAGVVASEYHRWISKNKRDTSVGIELGRNVSSRFRSCNLDLSSMKPIDAFFAMKCLEKEKDTRPPWYQRHHIYRS